MRIHSSNSPDRKDARNFSEWVNLCMPVRCQFPNVERTVVYLVPLWVDVVKFTTFPLSCPVIVVKWSVALPHLFELAGRELSGALRCLISILPISRLYRFPRRGASIWH